MSALSSGVDTEFPDAVAATLTRSNQSKQLTTRLNNAGTLLAVGCSDGAIVIYDFETRAVAKLLKGHTKPVIAVSWSRDSHHLLSASLDGLVIRWSVLAGVRSSYATFGAAGEEGEEKKIKNIQLHPNITDLAILNFSDHNPPLLVELSPVPTCDATAGASPTGSEVSSYVAESAPRPPRWARYISTPFQPYVAPTADTDSTAATTGANATPSDPSLISTAASAGTPAAAASTTTTAAAQAGTDDPREYYSKWHSTTAIFDNSGRFIFEGTSKGSILAYQLVWNAELRDKELASNTDVGGTQLPPYAQLRLIHVESNRAANARVRVPVTVVQSLVQSPCSAYLMCNNSNQIKVYRLDASLMSLADGADAMRAAHSEQLVLQESTMQVVQNGAFISLDVERHARLRHERDRDRLMNRAARKAKPNRAPRDANGVRKKRRERNTTATEDANEEEAEEKEPADAEEGEKEEEEEKKDATVVKVEENAVKEEEEDKEEVAVKEEDVDVSMKDTTAQVEEATVKQESPPATEAATVAAPTPAAVCPVPPSPAAAASDDEGGDAASVAGSSSGPVLTPLLEYTNTFSDQVNRVPWRRCCFSHSSDFIIAGSAERGEHRINIWSIHSGQLTKILLGPTEGLIDLTSHPTRPILVTCCTSGVIYLWNKNYVENWSAFAPDFEELDDNREYVEKEDEFDIVPLDPLKSRTHDDAFIDILSVDVDPNTNDLITLPATVMPDPETQAAYEMRRQIALSQRQGQATETSEGGASATANTTIATLPMPAPAAVVPMQDVTGVPTSPSIASKRPLVDAASDAAAAAEESHKRIKL